jgi:hypothetical protein
MRVSRTRFQCRGNLRMLIEARWLVLVRPKRDAA